MEGRILMFNVGRGYGFISHGVNQLFFHAKNFEKGFVPVKGRWVEFDIGPGLPGKPPQAVNIRYKNGSTLSQEFEEQMQKLLHETSLAGSEGAAQ